MSIHHDRVTAGQQGKGLARKGLVPLPKCRQRISAPSLPVTDHPLECLDDLRVVTGHFPAFVSESSSKDNTPGPEAARVGQIAQGCQSPLLPLHACRRQLIELLNTLQPLRGRLAGPLPDQLAVVVKGADVKPVAEPIKLALVASQFPGSRKQPVLQLPDFFLRGNLFQRHQCPTMSPVGNDRIILVDQVGRIPAGHCQEHFHVEVISRHGHGADMVLLLAVIKTVDNVLHHGPVGTAPEVPEDNLLPSLRHLGLGLGDPGQHCQAARQDQRQGQQEPGSKGFLHGYPPRLVR